MNQERETAISEKSAGNLPAIIEPEVTTATITFPSAEESDCTTATEDAEGVSETPDSIDETEVIEESIEPQEPESAVEYVTRAEVEALIEQAYLKGRNEAVEAQMLDASTLTALGQRPGKIADDVAAIFNTRPSVWDNNL